MKRFSTDLGKNILLGVFFLFAFTANGQIVISEAQSSSICYFEQSTNRPYLFNFRFDGVDANSVTFRTSAPGISFSNPMNGTQIDAQTLDFNGLYPIGENRFEFDISSSSDVGVVSIIATVTGIDFSSSIHTFYLSFVSMNPDDQMTCDGDLNVSLNSSCEHILNPEDILEGSNYHCWDAYTVNVIDTDGSNLGNILGSAQIGKTLQVEVTGPNNNICWGQVYVEDKFPPQLICQDINTSCLDDFHPGADISPNVPFSIPSQSLNDFQANVIQIEVSGLPGAIIDGVRLNLNLLHNNTNELTITLTDPNNVTEIVSNYSSEDFVGFNGSNPVGIWTLMIVDTQFSGTGHLGLLNGGVLNIAQSGGLVSFPVPTGFTIDSIGPTSYEVEAAFDACSQTDLTYIDNVSLPNCSSPYSQIITRNWYAQDQNGNNNYCTQIINVYRTGLESVVFPPNYDDIDEPSLDCKDYMGAVPQISVTGQPTGVQCVNIEVYDPVDIRLDICDASYKIIRTWTVVDWCSGFSVNHEQTIKVEPIGLPNLICSEVDTISTHPYDCYGIYFVPDFDAAQPLFNCSALANVYITYAVDNGSMILPSDSDFINANVTGTMASGFQVSGLPLGRSWIRYNFISECNERNTCTRPVDVLDLIPPNPVCDQHTVFSGVIEIAGFGNSFVEAMTFDDGSTDNCGDLTYEARKLVDICSNNTAFGPTVMFCCEEVNSSIMVEFKICDGADHDPQNPKGNCNSCFVDVSVQDNLFPYISNCPSNITLDCFSEEYLDPMVTGTPNFLDNCHAYIDDILYDTDDIDQCGEGDVVKTWIVTDDQGHTASCSQIISLSNNHRFTENDIVWPEDFEDSAPCDSENLEPGQLGDLYDFPDLSASDACDMVSHTHLDQVFQLFPEGRKILRNWTVIDWCQYDGTAGIWYHEQIIKCTNSGSNIVVQGEIRDEYNRMINNVDVSINSEQIGYPKIQTNDMFDGSYSFTNLNSGADYVIACEKDDDPLNGVSTIDLVQIQRHILKIIPFDTEFKMIAADVDDSGSISSIDLIQLRKLILGILIEFPNDQKNWRFVNSNFAVPQDAEPFPFLEVIQFYGLSASASEKNFVGVKIGDVTGDAEPITGIQSQIDNRSSESLNLHTEYFEKNDRSYVSYYADNYHDLLGFQLQMQFENDLVQDIIIHHLDMDESNFALSDKSLRISFNTNEAIYIDSDEPLFTLELKEKDYPYLESTSFRNEAYTRNLEIMDVTLRIENQQESLELYQNVPNPFHDQTVIRFNLPNEGEVYLKILDTNGRLITSKRLQANQGFNSFAITKGEVPSGLLYYQLETAFGSQTKKMFSIQ